MHPRVAAVGMLLAICTACSSPPFIDLPNPVTGTITQVLDDKIWISTETGQRFQFRNANPEDPGMGQEHMHVHRTERLPVLITWRRDGYELVAVRIEDAPQASATPSPTFPTPFGQ